MKYEIYIYKLDVVGPSDDTYSSPRLMADTGISENRSFEGKSDIFALQLT